MKHYNTVEEFEADGTEPRLFTMPAQEYRRIKAKTQSQVRNWLKSPSYWLAVQQEPPSPTEAMIMGSYFDALLTGDGIENFAVKTWDGRTKEGKAEADKHAGKQILSAGAATDVHRWLDSLLMNSEAKQLIEAAQKQVCAFGHIAGIPCVGRADLWIESDNHLLDIKLLTNAEPEEMSRRLTDGYDIQAAMYTELFAQATGQRRDEIKFTIVAQEKHSFSPTPHFTGLYQISQADIEVAYCVIETTLPKIANAEVFGIKGYGHHVISAKWPRPMPAVTGNGA
jgi:hypothetical protein